MGIAILGSLGTAVYRGSMASAIPAGVPLEAAEIAQETLGGAVAVASQLPDQIGTALLHAAHAAFAQGLQLTAITSTVLMVGAALLAVFLLRQVRPGSEYEAQPELVPEALVTDSETVLVPVAVSEEG